jgi:amidohydrolase
MPFRFRVTSAVLVATLPAAALAQAPAVADADLARRVEQEMPKVVAWRRDFHQHPELSNRETRTSGIVAEHLRKLGIEVRANVAKTGVVGVLRGARPGPVVALRADMDALPVTEQVDLPFKSTVRTTYNGQEVGVMHACGHDMHTAMLMGAAEVLAGMKDRLAGTVVFLFQPAEEGAPAGETGGAKQMLVEGAFANPKPGAVFGLHVGITPDDAGHLSYKPLGEMASSDYFTIVVRGRQAHGAAPWLGVDPITLAAQIQLGLQTIVSRQLDLTTAPAVVSIGMVQGGIRYNILPDSVVMTGTVRTFDRDMRKDVAARIRRTAESIAQSAGGTAEVRLEERAPVTSNDPALAERMLPTLRRVAGANGVSIAKPTTTAEDFGYFAEQVPGLFIFLGIRPKDSPVTAFVSNHSPKFFADEAAMPTGVRTLVSLAVDYLALGVKP